MILRFPEVSLRVHVESVPWETHIWFSLLSFSAGQKAYLSAHLSHSWVFDVDLKKKKWLMDYKGMKLIWETHWYKAILTHAPLGSLEHHLPKGAAF